MINEALTGRVRGHIVKAFPHRRTESVSFYLQIKKVVIFRPCDRNRLKASSLGAGGDEMWRPEFEPDPRASAVCLPPALSRPPSMPVLHCCSIK